MLNIKTMMAKLTPLLDEMIAEGEAKGRVEGQRVLFAMLLRNKFGLLPTLIEQRVAVAIETQLEAWSGRLFTAPTAAAVLGPMQLRPSLVRQMAPQGYDNYYCWTCNRRVPFGLYIRPWIKGEVEFYKFQLRARNKKNGPSDHQSLETGLLVLFEKHGIPVRAAGKNGWPSAAPRAKSLGRPGGAQSEPEKTVRKRVRRPSSKPVPAES